VFLLPLHAPILEPDLYLAFRQAESMRDLDATPPRQIAVEVELLLQLQSLIPGVRGPLPLRLAVRVHRACKLKVTLLPRGRCTDKVTRPEHRPSAIADFPRCERRWTRDAEETPIRSAMGDAHHRGLGRATRDDLVNYFNELCLMPPSLLMPPTGKLVTWQLLYLFASHASAINNFAQRYYYAI